MPAQITFTAYVLSVISDNRICVRVDSNFIKAISDLYSNASLKNMVRDTITINVKNSIFSISVPWSDLQSLVGMHIRIIAVHNKYIFWDSKEYPQEDGTMQKRSFQRRGLVFYAKKIKNITIDDE